MMKSKKRIKKKKSTKNNFEGVLIPCVILCIFIAFYLYQRLSFYYIFEKEGAVYKNAYVIRKVYKSGEIYYQYNYNGKDYFGYDYISGKHKETIHAGDSIRIGISIVNPKKSKIVDIQTGILHR